MARRKTISISDLVNQANDMLAQSRDDMHAERKGIATIVERVLFDTGNYAGFGYIGGYREGMDETRRIYYLKK